MQSAGSTGFDKWDEARFDPQIGADTIPRQLDQSAAAFGDGLFIAGEDGQRLSFTETRLLARRAARAFITSGLMPGERVAIWAPNIPEWIIACLGLQLAGGVMVPLNTRFKGEEAAYILEKSGAAMLCRIGRFLGNDYDALLRAARGEAAGGRPVERLPALRRVIGLDRDDWAAFLREGDSVSERDLDARIAGISPESLGDILFTSGTTGQPKGAMFSHRQSLVAVRSFNFIHRLEPGDRAAIVPPFFHNFGYRAGWLACLGGGMTAFPVSEFNPAQFVQLIARERITAVVAPPPVLQAIVDHRLEADVSSLRVTGTGSAAIDPNMIRDCEQKLGMEIVLTSYGLTENTGLATSNRADDDVETRAQTVGYAFPGCEMRVVDSDNRPVGPGDPGEVCMRGALVMQGYLDDPEATAATIDSEGWLHTGDVGIVDERGYLRLIDRLKDIVIVGGFNAYPAEIEALLAGAPGVAEVAVVGMPDRRLGEVCAAFVVPRDDAAIDEAGLTAWARGRMANYKVPRRFVAMDALPRTPLGKVRRVALRETAKGLAPIQPPSD